MSTRRFVPACLVLLASLSGAAAADPPGIRSVSLGPGWLAAVRALPDGGAIAVGRVSGRDAPRPAWIVRIDKDGNRLWSNEPSAPESRDADLEALFPRPDGALIAVGTAKFRSAPSGDGRDQDYAVTIRPDGTIVESRMFGEALAGWYRMTIPLVSGGFASVADETSLTKKPSQVLVFYDREHREVRRVPIETTLDATNLLRETPAGEIVAIRRHNVAGSNPPAEATTVMFLSAAGDLRRETRIEIAGAEEISASAMVVAPSGDVFVVGLVDAPTGPVDPPIWLAKLAPDGRLLWARRAGRAAFTYPLAMIVTPDGFVVVGGCLGPNLDAALDPWLARFDSDGNLDAELVRRHPGGGIIMGLDIGPGGDILATGVRGNGCGPLAALSAAWVRDSDRVDEAFIDTIAPSALQPARR
jgi:hypothetical protein